MELFLNAIVSGLLLGGFYAAVTLGLAISFGYLDIVNIAHPAFVIVGSYVAYMLNLEIGVVPVRMLVPFVVALAMTACVYLYLSRTFAGRAILAVSQDRLALRLMGADPVKIKQLAFGLSIATAALAGALLIVIGPVEPSMNRLYIGRVFAIVVLGGMGSIGGTLVAALILGVAESFVATFYGPSWAPAVAFGVLLCTLALRPQGIFGRY